MTAWQTLARIQRGITAAPTDDRVGCAAPIADPLAGIIGGPDFEMPAAMPAPARQAARRPIEPASRPAEPVRQAPAPEPVAAEPAEPVAGQAAAEPVDSAEPGRPIGQTFILAGNAIFTLIGQASRYTFKVSRKDPEPGSQYADRGPVYFVALLTGPDNTADYSYVGMLDASRGTIRLTRKSAYKPDSLPVRAFDWTIGRLWLGRPIEPARVLHAGRCGRCGRVLTVPASIESGFGPECIGKIGG
jgi:hypothetical protein